MSKFKVGDRVVMTKDRDGAQKGMKGTIVATMECGDWGVRFDEKFDGGHDLRGKCETGYGHWIAPDEMEIFEEPKFEVGQIYRVEENPFNGTIAKVESIHDGKAHVKVIRGNKGLWSFNKDAKVTLLTGKEIGEAIRKYDADHAEKKTGVREVKRNAEAGEWVKVLTGGGHHAPVGEIFKVIRPESIEGWVRVFLSDTDSAVLRAGQYVVLEGYKPEQKEKPRKAKAGDTVRILREHGGRVIPGKIGVITRVFDNHECVQIDGVDGLIVHGDQGHYEIISSGKHSYTAEQIAKAKKLCGEMMVEAFDDNKTFAFHFYDKQNGGYKGDCEENEVKAEFRSLDGTDVEGVAKCSNHDEYNVWIGRCVALCKALHKPIPAFIMGDGKGRHFDFEKAKAEGTNPYFTGEKVVTIHCKTESEARQLLGELSKDGYRWGDKTPLLSEINFSNGNGYYNAYSSKTVTFNRGAFENVAEFSDCFTED